MTDDSSSKSPLARSSKPRGHAKRKRWLSRGLWALVGLGLIAATVFAFLPKPIPVELATVERGLLRVTVDENGKSRVIDRYVVSAPLAGHMARIELHPGDAVEVGTLLATLEPVTPPLLDARTRAETEARLLAAQAAKRQADAAVGRAKLAEEFASKERERIAELVGKGTLPSRNLDIAELELRTREQELVSARFGVRVAVYEVEVAKAALKRIEDAGTPKPGKPGTEAGDDPEPRDGVIEVRSPIAGRVLRVLQEHEGVMQLGTALVELADLSALEVVVDVLTTDAVQIRPGDPVILRDWGGRDPLSGRVRLIEPSAFTKVSALGVEEQRVNVIIDLDKSADTQHAPRRPGAHEPTLEAGDSPLSSLGDGYRVEVSIIVWEGDDVLLLPVSALFRADQGWAVWKVVDGHARLQAVEIGQREGLKVEIVDGLAVADQVVVHPSDAVVDGIAIAVE